jgi:hypothetical protein
MPGDKQPNHHTSLGLDALNAQSLIQALIDENTALRKALSEVSAVGATMMFHTHRRDCAAFSTDFLKAVVQIDQTLECARINDVFQDGLSLAASVPAWEQHQAPLNHPKMEKHHKQ